MTKRGEIKYSLWTLTGSQELEIKYTLKIEDEKQGIGELLIKGPGSDPNIDEETMGEIMALCMEDSLDREPIEENPYLAAEGYDFSKN